MPVLKKLEKHKHVPVALLYKGAEPIGVELAKLLIEQGAFVIIIDEYSDKKKDVVSPLQKKDLFSFFDISGTASLADSIGRVDYIFYFNHQLRNPEEEVSTREFLDQSNRLDRLLQLGVDKKSKFLLTTSIRLHKLLQQQKDASITKDQEEALQYNILEVQRYAENLTWEYYKRGGLDARIIRTGEMLGEGVDLDVSTLLGGLLQKAITGKKLELEGDGLESVYYVHLLDAAYGLIKALFTEKASGKIYSLVIPRDITALNLAYKILDLEPKAAGIDFVEKTGGAELNVYKPASNLKDLGWKPKVSFERALAQTIDYAYTFFGKTKGRAEKKEGAKETPPDEKPKEVVEHVQKVGPADEKKKSIKDVVVDLFFEKKQEQKKEPVPTPEVQKAVEVEPKKQKPRKSVKDSLVNFFFEVKEEKKSKSILDNVQYQQKSSQNTRSKTVKPSNVSLTSQQKKINRDKGINGLLMRIAALYDRVKKSIRGLSLPSVFGYTLVGVLLIFLYVLVFIPLLRVTYYSGMAYVRGRDLANTIENWEFESAQGKIQGVVGSLENVDSNVDRLSFLTSFRFFDDIETFQGVIREDIKLLNAYEGLMDDLIIVESYLNDYESSVNLLGEDDLIVGSPTQYNLADLGQLEASIRNIDQISGNFSVESVNLNIPVVGERFAEFQDGINQLANNGTSITKTLSVVPDLLAVNEKQTHVLLMLDSNQLTPRGGKITAICVFTMYDGGIEKIKVYSPSELDISLTAEQKQIVQNELRGLYPKGGLLFEDLTLIEDEKLFFELASEALFGVYEEFPNAIISVNGKSLGALFESIEKIDLASGGSIDSTNFNLRVGESKLHKELLAKVVKKLLEFDKSKLEHMQDVFNEHYPTKDIVLYSEDIDLKNYFYPSASDTPVSNRFSVGFVSSSSETPDVKVESQITLDEVDVREEYLVSLFQDSQELLEGKIVLYFGEKFNISKVTSDSEDVSLESSPAMVVGEMNLPKDKKVTLLVKGTTAGVVSEDANGYNYSVRVGKAFGALYEYSFDFIYTNFSLVSSPSDGSGDEGILNIDGISQADQLWKFTYTAK